MLRKIPKTCFNQISAPANAPEPRLRQTKAAGQSFHFPRPSNLVNPIKIPKNHKKSPETPKNLSWSVVSASSSPRAETKANQSSKPQLSFAKVSTCGEPLAPRKSDLKCPENNPKLVLIICKCQWHALSRDLGK